MIDAVRDKLEVRVDGGVRRGSDVVKALAMGAKAVLLGRAPLSASLQLAAVGVSEVLQILRDEYKSRSGCWGAVVGTAGQHRADR